VNARSAPDTDWDRSASPPGSLFILLQSASVPIDRYSHESIETLKDIVARWNLLRELATLRAQRSGGSAPDAPPPVTLYAIDVSFDGIEDPAERSYFMNLPTSFVLPPEAVDRLRGTAGRLLRESREFEALVRELGGTGTR
jgi:NTE family protein